MQEIHSIGGGGIFGGGGDRRLRPHHQNHHQALKCPRCDSLNTKFCYYNNYNLSQPRHFCKNCRRYWTKGGVLRNVPVGGGCRKSKRSNKPKNNSNGDNNNTSSSETAPATTPIPQPPPEAERKANSHSSSESSTLTAAATEAISAPTSNAAFLSENVRESKVLANPPLELEHVGNGGDHSGIFSEIGTFTSLITSTNEALAFGFGNNSNVLDASSFRFSVTRQRRNDPLQAGVAPDCSQLGQCQWQQQNQEFAAASLFNHTVPVVFSPMQNRTDHGGFGSLDWHVPADQSLLHLPNTFDQTYWSHTQWSDQDNHTLFPLP